jgi:hypothetical protein
MGTHIDVIYDANGERLVIFDGKALDYGSAVHEEELMGQDFIRMSWYSHEKTVLPVGSYIIVNDIKFMLLDEYAPKQENIARYKYEPEFLHPVMWLGKLPFIHCEGDTTSWERSTKRFDWTYYGSPATIAGEMARYINFLGDIVPGFRDIFGNGWTSDVKMDLVPVKLLSFQAVDILSAAAEMANKFECEYHFDFDQKVFRLGKVSYDKHERDPLVLKCGQNVGVPTVSESKEGYHNCFQVLGGTKNMTQDSASGPVQSTKRLTLDETRYPDSIIDTRPNGSSEPMLVRQLVFDDVYPKMELYIYDVRERKCWLLDSETGNRVETTEADGWLDESDGKYYKYYSKWYLRLAYQENGEWKDYVLTEDKQIKDTSPTLLFQINGNQGAENTPLAGQEFDVVSYPEENPNREYNADEDIDPNGFQPRQGDYRIEFKEENGMILPTTSKQGICPRTIDSDEPDILNNIVTLANVVLDNVYESKAKADLKSAADRAIERLMSDLDSYTFPSDPVVFEENNPHLFIGQSVVYDDGQDLHGGISYTLSTHIRKLVTKLDHPEQVTITVGNEKMKGNISSMKDQIDSIITGGYGTGSGSGSGGSSYTDSQLLQIVRNYGSRFFISKLNDDVAAGEIGFMKGLWTGAKKWFFNALGNINANRIKAEADLEVSGDATIEGNVFAKQSVRTDEVRSSNYTGDTIADTGFLLTAGLTNGLGHSKLTVDEIYVRMKAVFESLEVKRWNVTAGDEINSCAANIINRVDYFTDTGELLGYSYVRIPWMVSRMPFLLKLFGNDSSKWGRFIYSKLVRMRITLSDADLLRVRFCRCYFLADDGDTQIENWWENTDLARCQTHNVLRTTRNTYTSIQTKNANVFWWRKVLRTSQNGVVPSENPDITNCQPAIIDEKIYHWFDVAYNRSKELAGTSLDCAAGSDLPAAGDHAIQFGNTTIPGRMNLWIKMVRGGQGRDYDPDGDAPCIKGFVGIYTFDLNKCWMGGHPCKMTLAPGKKSHFSGKEFRIIKEYGEVPVPTQRGEWSKIALEKDEFNTRPTYTDDVIDGSTHTRADGKPLTYARKCYWNDEVSHLGCTWQCSIADGSHWIASAKFTYNGTTYNVGDLVPAGVYSALPEANKVMCESHENYTTEEPSSTSPDWTKIVDRGTSITHVETRYQKKSRLKYNSTLKKYEVDETAGTVPPSLPWEQWKLESQISQLQMKDGDYYWSCTKTEYSDTLEPTYEYKVTRWGIDSDGIDINTYFLGLSNNSTRVTAANDNYKMPDASGWSSADAQAKWFDTFDAMAQANGGVSAMQGWNVWTKTIIKYDPDENRSDDEQKPDVIQYSCTRIGQDGQIAEEEYYMLAESDDFATVFPNYSYGTMGIRWYNATNPATGDYRLSSTTPNINTALWSNRMPVYDASTEANGRKKYLWNFEYRVDGRGTQYATMPRCIGNHAKGITGVQELYALSAYATPRSGGKVPSDIYSANGNSDTAIGSSSQAATNMSIWVDEVYDRAPSEAKPYQWNMTITTYSDGTKQYIYHVSAVRGTKGEDGAGTEYIYCRTQTATPPTGYNGTTGTANGTAISGTVTVNGQTVNKCRAVDDFVPSGWTDNPVGISHDWPYEWVCERKSTSYSGTGGFSGGHLWGEFSAPAPRSKWGYNGVDGDGTEYVFIRTKNNVAPAFSANDIISGYGTADGYKSMEWLPYINNQTACGAESNRCTDDPKGTTAEWPYEWCAKRNMGTPSTNTANYGHREWKSFYECMDDHKMSKWSTYTTLRLDIDNEMDMVQTDSTGKVTKTRTVQTKVHLYDGGSLMSIGLPTVTVRDGSGNVVSLAPTFSPASGNTTERTLSWTFSAGSAMKEVYEVNIKYTYNNLDYNATFTIVASLGQPVYQLKPTPAALRCIRNTNNTLSAPAALALSIVRVDGNSTTEITSYSSAGIVTDNGSTLSVRYSLTAMPTSKTDGTAWPVSNSVQASTSNDNIFIALFNSSGVLVDRETIPIVKDGAHGENSVRLDIDNENDSILYDGAGNKLSGNVTSTAYMYDGAEDVSAKTTWTVTASGCTVSSGNSRYITVTGMTSDTAKVTVQGVYTDAHGNTHTKTSVLTLKKLVGVDKYDLVITPNALALNVTDGWSQSKAITVQVMRTPANGGTPSAIDPSTYGLAITASVGTLSGSGSSRTLTITQTQATNNDGTTITLHKSGDTTKVYDSETIPFNKSANGKSVDPNDPAIQQQITNAVASAAEALKSGLTIVIKPQTIIVDQTANQAMSQGSAKVQFLRDGAALNLSVANVKLYAISGNGVYDLGSSSNYVAGSASGGEATITLKGVPYTVRTKNINGEAVSVNDYDYDHGYIYFEVTVESKTYYLQIAWYLNRLGQRVTETLGDVQTTYMSKTEYEQSVIGGTNLIRFSSTPKYDNRNDTTIDSNDGTWTRASDGGVNAGTREVFDFNKGTNPIIPPVPAKQGIRINRTSNHSTAMDIRYNAAKTTVKNIKYTLSVYARKTTSSAAVLRLQFIQWDNNGTAVDSGAKTSELTTEWVRYSYTFTAKGTEEWIYLGLAGGSAAATIEMCGFKLERGEKATEWSSLHDDDLEVLKKDYAAQIQTSASNLTSEYQQYVNNNFVTKSVFNQTADEIRASVQGKADQSSITQLSNQISLKVSKSDYDTNNTNISNRFSTIEQTADAISLRVTNLSNGISSTGIDITNGEINLIAGKVKFKASNGTSNNTYMSIGSDGKLTVDSITATNGSFSGSVTASSGNIGNMTINSDGSLLVGTSSDKRFYVDASGNVTMKGSITATGGKIGNMSINPSNSVALLVTKGSGSSLTETFKVTTDGDVTMNDVSLTGNFQTKNGLIKIFNGTYYGDWSTERSNIVMSYNNGSDTFFSVVNEAQFSSGGNLYYGTSQLSILEDAIIMSATNGGSGAYGSLRVNDPYGGARIDPNNISVSTDNYGTIGFEASSSGTYFYIWKNNRLYAGASGQFDFFDKSLIIEGGIITSIDDDGGSAYVGNSIIPSASRSYDLGSSSYRWENAYVLNVYANTLHAGVMSFSVNSGGGASIDASSAIGLGITSTNISLSATNSITANRQITVSSDMSLKTFRENVSASIEDIARTPIFNFEWKDTNDGALHLGTSAQYIQNIFRHAVQVMDDGKLALDYGSVALASAVLTARTVLTHEEKIAVIEKEIERLNNIINNLKGN